MRPRDVLALVAGVAVVVVAVAVGWAWIRSSTDGPAVTADPVATASAYLQAWEAGDHLGMVDYVRDPPAELVARHEQLRDGLGIETLAAHPGSPREDVDGRTFVPVEVRAQVAYSPDPLTWDVELTVERVHGEWAVVWSLASIHPELRTTWHFDTETEPVERAPILAFDGTPLAGSGTRITLGFEPSTVRNPDAVVSAFELAVPGTGAVAEREFRRGNLVDGWFYPVVTLSEQRAQRAWNTLRGVPGVLRQVSQARAPYDDGFAQHVVGVVAEATAEQLEERRARGEEATPGMHVPQFGLELTLDDELTGSDLVRAGIREGEDGPMRVVIAETQEDPSGPVRTTIDVTVQEAVETALRDQDGTIGIVVVDATDGAIVAAASRPLGDYNRAFAGRYPPGSTFKIVTAEALLAGGATLGDPVPCPGETIVGGLRIPNAGGFDLGEVDLLEAFTASCNTSFATLGARAGEDALTAAAGRFGFGAAYDLPLSAFGGSFPPPVDTAELAAAAFGQGRVETSVLHLASVAAAAEFGVWHPPYLLAADGPHAGIALSTDARGPLRRMLREAVTDGTGTLADVPGLEVRGKTGTAQASDGVDHAWFAGSWNGYGFAVLVEGGGAGGTAAAPIAARFVARLAVLTGQATQQDLGDFHAPDESEDPDAPGDDPTASGDGDTTAPETEDATEETEDAAEEAEAPPSEDDEPDDEPEDPSG